MRADPVNPVADRGCSFEIRFVEGREGLHIRAVSDWLRVATLINLNPVGFIACYGEMLGIDECSCGGFAKSDILHGRCRRCGKGREKQKGYRMSNHGMLLSVD